MVQKNILQRMKTAGNIKAGVGALALGKPGDIITRAYGPVVRAAEVAADSQFGAYVAGKGVLVNSGDCAAVGNKFETVTGLKAGQVGSFLVSGACVVLRSQINGIGAAMKVQYVDPEAELKVTDAPWVEYAAWAAGAIKVGDYVESSGKLYRCKEAHTAATAIDLTKFDLVGTLVGDEAAFDKYGTYSQALCKVTANSKKYSNLEPIVDGVFEIEVNGFDA